MESAESHWTETVHQFKDWYPNLIDVENPLEKNDTDVRVETESISPTNLSNSEESRQNFEDTSSTQDQDFVQEQIQERMEPESEIIISKFYIKNCCKHGLSGNNCNYQQPAPWKNDIENKMDADQNAQITTLIYANILGNSESATM